MQDDTATVREGDTVSVPVLDNDTMADGIPLQVDPASVKVVSKGDAQRAFASGNVIRYVPEARGLQAERFVTVEYAAYADGMKDRAQTARVRVAGRAAAVGASGSTRRRWPAASRRPSRPATR